MTGWHPLPPQQQQEAEGLSLRLVSGQTLPLWGTLVVQGLAAPVAVVGSGWLHPTRPQVASTPSCLLPVQGAQRARGGMDQQLLLQQEEEFVVVVLGPCMSSPLTAHSVLRVQHMELQDVPCRLISSSSSWASHIWVVCRAVMTAAASSAGSTQPCMVHKACRLQLLLLLVVMCWQVFVWGLLPGATQQARSLLLHLTPLQLCLLPHITHLWVQGGQDSTPQMTAMAWGPSSSRPARPCQQPVVCGAGSSSCRRSGSS